MGFFSRLFSSKPSEQETHQAVVDEHQEARAYEQLSALRQSDVKSNYSNHSGDDEYSAIAMTPTTAASYSSYQSAVDEDELLLAREAQAAKNSAFPTLSTLRFNGLPLYGITMFVFLCLLIIYMSFAPAPPHHPEEETVAAPPAVAASVPAPASSTAVAKSSVSAQLVYDDKLFDPNLESNGEPNPLKEEQRNPSPSVFFHKKKSSSQKEPSEVVTAPDSAPADSANTLPVNSSPFARVIPPRPPLRIFDWCYNCTDRCDHIVESINYQASSISLTDRRMKLREMAASLPRFFRGVDHLYLQDIFMLANTSFFRFTSPKTVTFIDADMHLYNYGTYENSRGQVVYDMNDFDQSLMSVYLVDLWRTATSLTIHMRINGIPQEDQIRILGDFAKTYVDAVQSFVGNDREIGLYLTENNTEGAIFELIREMEQHNQRTLLDSLCYLDSTHTRRLDWALPGLGRASPEEFDWLRRNWRQYLDSLGVRHRHFRPDSPLASEWRGAWESAGVSKEEYYKVKSFVRRVGAGLSSMGVPRFFALIEGPSTSQDDDIVLDVKFEPAPEWWNFIHSDIRSVNENAFKSQGERISTAIHALLFHVDGSVGWIDSAEGSFVIRPYSTAKGSIDVDSLISPIRFHSYATQLAFINAINHCRGDNDYNAELIPYSFEEELSKVIGGHLHEFADNFVQFSVMNADRITADFECFIRSGIAEKFEDEVNNERQHSKGSADAQGQGFAPEEGEAQSGYGG